MLVLGRKENEAIVIAGLVKVTVMEIRRHHGDWQVRLGIEAPPEVEVNREEVQEAIDRGERRGGRSRY